MPKKKQPEQPEINIGLVGHVDHGKTTLTQRLSGKWTDTHSEELKRGITIKLGYANTTFYYCSSCKKYCTRKKCAGCEGECTELRKVSFVDAPGHESLMATMLAGATIIDGAILLVSAAEDCPQAQTREHIMALHISGIKNIVVVQNKIDLVSREEALQNYKQIKKFLSETEYKDAPIIPISARVGANVDKLIEAIEKYIPTPKRDDSADPIMLIARSFDINKPGTQISKIQGGVLGGALKRGVLNVGDEIEIRPGRVSEGKKGYVWHPVKTKIICLKTGECDVNKVKPGGSIGVMTTIDPSIVKSDQLMGCVAGLPNKLPSVWDRVSLKVTLLKRVVGTKEETEAKPLAKGEVLMLNVNSTITVGQIIENKKDSVVFTLKKPICADVGDRITISRRMDSRFRLIGFGIIK